MNRILALFKFIAQAFNPHIHPTFVFWAVTLGALLLAIGFFYTFFYILDCIAKRVAKRVAYRKSLAIITKQDWYEYNRKVGETVTQAKSATVAANSAEATAKTALAAAQSAGSSLGAIRHEGFLVSGKLKQYERCLDSFGGDITLFEARRHSDSFRIDKLEHAVQILVQKLETATKAPRVPRNRKASTSKIR
jgi:hypothetical protein